MPFVRPLAALLLCSVAAPAAGPPAHRVKGDRVIEARQILTKYCGSCHGEQSPRGRLQVLDHKAVAGHHEPYPFLGDAKAAGQVLDLIEDGSMPPGLHPRPTAAEVKVLQEWVKDGAPEYPRQFSDTSAKDAVLADFRTLEEFKRDGVRYVSLAHLADAAGGVAKAEAALRDALRDGFELPDAELQAVDPAGTVFRLDIRPLGWNHRDLFVENDKAGVKDNVFPIIPFDLILLEYPFGVPADKWGADGVSAMKAMTAHKDLKPWDLFRPQLFLRGDWLTTALRRENKPTPLADELWALKRLGDAPSADERAKLVGPKPRPFAGPAPANGGRAPRGSWAVMDAGEQPFLCVVEKDPPGAAAADGSTFKLFARCDRDTHARLVAVFPDGEVHTKPLERGSDQVKKGVRTQLWPNDEGTFNINCGPGDLYYVLFAFEKPTDASGNPIRVQTVKSAHAKNPIHRFFPSDPAASAVRKVTRIKVAD